MYNFGAKILSRYCRVSELSLTHNPTPYRSISVAESIAEKKATDLRTAGTLLTHQWVKRRFTHIQIYTIEPCTRLRGLILR